jgi:pimeloyl-ACP methyl ester carboxylesterase
VLIWSRAVRKARKDWYGGPFVVAALLVLLEACGGESGAGVEEPTMRPTAQSPSRSATLGLVDIGGGREVFAECDGTGTPTILLESGDESDSTQWNLVYSSLVKETRTCRYDRLGNGQSDAATGCRRLADLRGDLEALLRALHDDGPYVLVGTSGGGYLVAGFAYAHPKSVAGIVLVETPHAIVRSEAPPELLAELRCNSPQNQERRDYVGVENEAWSHRKRVGDIPMTIISNDYGSSFENEEQRTNVEDQKGWFVLSPQARQVVVTSGHDVAYNESGVVIREILRVLEASRDG